MQPDNIAFLSQFHIDDTSLPHETRLSRRIAFFRHFKSGRKQRHRLEKYIQVYLADIDLLEALILQIESKYLFIQRQLDEISQWLIDTLSADHRTEANFAPKYDSVCPYLHRFMRVADVSRDRMQSILFHETTASPLHQSFFRVEPALQCFIFFLHNLVECIDQLCFLLEEWRERCRQRKTQAYYN